MLSLNSYVSLIFEHRTFQTELYVDHSAQFLDLDDFINKELIQFSMADNVRSIPSMVDGLKPGQRKILFSCFKRKLKGEIKVRFLEYSGWPILLALFWPVD